VSIHGARNLTEYLAETPAEAMYSDRPRSVASRVCTTVIHEYERNRASRTRDSWGKEVR
jgi:hypothetical protein